MNKSSKRLTAQDSTVTRFAQSSFAQPIEDERDARGRDHQASTQRCDEATTETVVPSTVEFTPRVAIARGVLIFGW